jgi:hypothetical protein
VSLEAQGLCSLGNEGKDYMRPTLVRIVVAGAFLLAGWSAGRAQGAKPDFVLLVDSPNGTTTVECVRGCELVFARSADNPRAGRLPRFTYTCRSPEGQCSSQEIAGWVKR